MPGPRSVPERLTIIGDVLCVPGGVPGKITVIGEDICVPWVYGGRLTGAGVLVRLQLVAVTARTPVRAGCVGTVVLTAAVLHRALVHVCAGR